MSNPLTTQPHDAIIIGAGFGGCNLLHSLRNLSFKTHIFEEAPSLGGVWYHNRYPGARVDTKVPFYEFSDPALYNAWEWSELYPGQAEILQYFDFVESKWDLKKDITFGVRVTSTIWDAETKLWTVKTNKGHVAHSRFLLCSMGFAAKKFVPHIPGLEDFRGFSCHTAEWPEDAPELAGKRVAVMGTGATGVQIIQELGPQVAQLTVLQRSPNCALPMRQKRHVSPADKTRYAELFANMRFSITGSDYPPTLRKAAEDTHEQRVELYERLWEKGGFAPSHGNYMDMMTDVEANNFFYEFWREKTRARLRGVSAEMIEELAPMKAPFAFGTKRPSLEQRFYEVFNQGNVDLVPLKKNPIERVVSDGIVLADGRKIELDAIILATGFDAVTGSFTRLDIRGTGGKNLSDEWKERTHTHLGMVTSGFPNLFFQYGPQSPTAFANGPLISEIQAEWIVATMVHMRENGYEVMDVGEEMEEKWSEITNEACYRTLMSSNATTWYMGGNVPGKKREALGYMESIKGKWEGFRFS
ncbi:FAD/NAD(P)-binding domain-containing protein [Aspergillus karnatakaensis]|uniref:flavin-containing monooxygenase n=1 Tax=Aspergillus karnatakaensis TaxID=1810916 RepID=UPI003CCDBD6D